MGGVSVGEVVIPVMGPCLLVGGVGASVGSGVGPPGVGNFPAGVGEVGEPPGPEAGPPEGDPARVGAPGPEYPMVGFKVGFKVGLHIVGEFVACGMSFAQHTKTIKPKYTLTLRRMMVLAVITTIIVLSASVASVIREEACQYK